MRELRGDERVLVRTLVQWLNQIWASQPIEFLTFIVLSLTLGAVVYYAAKTREVVVAAQRQNDTAIRPVIVIEYPRDRVIAQDNFGIRNIGFGPAFNVMIKPIENGDYRAEFTFIPLLGKDSHRILEPITYVKGEYHPVGSPMMQYFMKMLGEGTKGLDDVLTLTIEISCCDANGKRYVYRQKLECERPMMLVKLTYLGVLEGSQPR